MDQVKTDTLLNRAECSALKGIGILGIMLHNYCHWLPGIIKENEYTFNIGHGEQLQHYFSIGINGNVLVQLLSVFGHYGVPLFVFLSAYGLVKKYESPQAPLVNRGSFIGNHYLKLFRLMIIGYVLMIVFTCWIYGKWPTNPVYLVGGFFMVTNVLPFPNPSYVYPGPYWFLGLMVELYIIYRLLLYRPGDSLWKGVGGPLLLIVVSWLPQVFLGAPDDQFTLLFLRYNFFQVGMAFALGLLCARYMPRLAWSKWLWAGVMVVSLAVVYVAQLNYQLWLWAHLFVITAAVGFIKITPQWLMKALVWVGALSSFIFIVHPIVRMFIFGSNVISVQMWILIYAVLSILGAMLYRWVLSFVPQFQIKPKR